MRPPSKRALYTSLLVLAGVGVAVHLASGAPGCVPQVQPGQTIALLGDSLAVGLTAPLRALAKEAGVTLVADAEVGARVDPWLNPTRLGGLLAYNPSVVVISLGTNDTYTNRSPEELRARFEKLVNMLQASGRPILWVLPPALPKEDRASPQILTLGIPTFDTKSLTLQRSPDGIHMTGKGYAAWAAAVWAALTCTPASAVGLAGPASFAKPIRRLPRRRQRRSLGVFKLR